MKPKVIAIVGPTAAGKSSLGIAIAKTFGGEVVSVDSRQIHKGMDIGTGKVEGAWQEFEIEKGGAIDQLFGARKRFISEGVVHWGIDMAEPDVEYSAADFKEYAQDKIEELVGRGVLPVLVGGTGFWLKAVIDDLDMSETPADPMLRAELEQLGVGALHARYKKLDPEGAREIDRQNKRRLVRAIEVSELTGVPFSQHVSENESPYDVLQIGVDIARDVLYERINTRVDEMVAKGLVSEVRALRERYGCEIPSMTAIGYRQICAFLNGDTSLKEAIEDVKRESRRYAKRQMTWFKRDDRVRWLKDSQEAMRLVEEFL